MNILENERSDTDTEEENYRKLISYRSVKYCPFIFI